LSDGILSEEVSAFIEILRKDSQILPVTQRVLENTKNMMEAFLYSLHPDVLFSQVWINASSRNGGVNISPGNLYTFFLLCGERVPGAIDKKVYHDERGKWELTEEGNVLFTSLDQELGYQMGVPPCEKS